ncbi:MAG: hypothetical protein ACOYJ2_02730, partial [Rickettsiales bacterium]
GAGYNTRDLGNDIAASLIASPVYQRSVAGGHSLSALSAVPPQVSRESIDLAEQRLVESITTRPIQVATSVAPHASAAPSLSPSAPASPPATASQYPLLGAGEPTDSNSLQVAQSPAPTSDITKLTMPSEEVRANGERVRLDRVPSEVVGVVTVNNSSDNAAHLREAMARPNSQSMQTFITRANGFLAANASNANIARIIEGSGGDGSLTEEERTAFASRMQKLQFTQAGRNEIEAIRQQLTQAGGNIQHADLIQTATPGSARPPQSPARTT